MFGQEPISPNSVCKKKIKVVERADKEMPTGCSFRQADTRSHYMPGGGWWLGPAEGAKSRGGPAILKKTKVKASLDSSLSGPLAMFQLPDKQK